MGVNGFTQRMHDTKQFVPRQIDEVYYLHILTKKKKFSCIHVDIILPGPRTPLSEQFPTDSGGGGLGNRQR